MLPLAVVLHRIPEGLAIWWLFRSLAGSRLALGVLGVVGVATIAGFAVSAYFVKWIPEKWIVMLQAFVAGCLLHVVAHHRRARGTAGDRQQAHMTNVASGVGSLFGLGLVLATMMMHPVSSRVAPGADDGMRRGAMK